MLITFKNKFVKRNTFYDGEGGDGGDGGKGGETNKGGEGGDGGKGGEANKGGSGNTRTYTQAELDKIVEGEKIRLKEQTRTQINQLEDLKKNLSLTEEAKSNLQLQIDELNQTLLSKEELAKKEKEKIENETRTQMDKLTKDRDSWEMRFKDSLLTRNLTDAALGEEAFNPEVVVNLLKEKSKVLELTDETNQPTGKYAVKVYLEGKDKDNKPTKLSLEPKDAVRLLKDDQRYHFMFKSTAGSGVGGAGNQLGADVDPSNLTFEQYQKNRDKFKSTKGK